METLYTGGTFALAYALQKEREAEAKLKAKVKAKTLLINSIERLDGMLAQALTSLDNRTLKVSHMKEMMTRITDPFKHRLVARYDKNKFDIIHHCILVNNPEIIDLLLSDASFCPPTHQPTAFPYAHLAATVGHPECLRMILTKRPKDFFKCSLPKHSVTMEARLERKFKLRKPVVKRNVLVKKTEALLAKFNACSEAEEQTILNAAKLSAFSETVDLVLKDKGEIVDIPSMTSSSNNLPLNPPASKNKASLDSTITQPEPHGYLTLYRLRKNTTRLPKGEHCISIYNDMFSKEPPGVLAGAGVAARVQLKLPSLTQSPSQAGLQTKTCLDSTNPGISVFPEIDSMQENSTTNYEKTELTHNYNNSYQRRGSLKGIFDDNSCQINPSQFSKDKKIDKEGEYCMEFGIRKNKVYKKFELKPRRGSENQRTRADDYMNKTPLTMAAERGYIECIEVAFKTIILAANPLSNSDELLTMATLARSPETIVYILDNKFSRPDYENALLTAIRRLFPDCLAVLLSTKKKKERNLFEGKNLYHMLYSQSLNADVRYELMPEMTKVLIAGGCNVNSTVAQSTFPMHSLITCAFSLHATDKIFFYSKCLELLLKNNANTHYDEQISEGNKGKSGLILREAHHSAIYCLFENVLKSIEQFMRKDWTIFYMKRFLTIIIENDKCTGAANRMVMFEYLGRVYELGLEKSVLNMLMRYGADPDAKNNGMYAINLYFDRLFSYLKDYRIKDSYKKYSSEIDILRLLCVRMSMRCLNKALVYFLDKQLPSSPVQGVRLSRYFCWVVNDILRTPLPLRSISALRVWNLNKRNVKYAEKLPLSTKLMKFIIP